MPLERAHGQPAAGGRDRLMRDLQCKGKRPITVTLTRTQSRVLAQAAAKFLRDRVECPDGPGRNALLGAVEAIHQARDN